MNDQHKDLLRLRHIKEAISDIEKISVEITKELISDNIMLRQSLAWNIMIIGEAASRLSQEFREGHPDTDWRGIIGMRNILVHEYFKIDEDELWQVVLYDIPILKTQIVSYINNFA